MAVQKQDGLHTDVGESAVDLRGKENRFCRRDATGKVVLCGAGERAEGVISEGKDVGRHTSFNTAGNPILRVMAGAALAAGDYVGSDAEGRAIPAAVNVFGRVRFKPVSGAGVIAEVYPGHVADTVDNV